MTHLARALRCRHIAASFATLAAWSLDIFVAASIATLAAHVTRWHEVAAFGCTAASLVAYVLSLAAEEHFDVQAKAELGRHIDALAGE